MIAQLYPLVVVLIFAALTLTAVLVPKGAFAAKSRLDVVVSVLNFVAVLLLARLLIAWTVVPPLVWLFFVAALAVSVIGAVLRWTVWPVTRATRPAVRSWIYAGINVVVVVAVLVLVFG